MSKRTFDWLRLLLLALAVAGLLLSMVLVRMHSGESVSDTIAWMCGGPKDCNKVVRGPFSELTIFPPRPIPIATIGMAYFTVLGAWLLMVGRLPGKLHRMWAIAALIGLAGLAGSGWMIYIMAVKIEAWCRACLATHAINLPLVLGIWTLWLAGSRKTSDDQAEEAAAGNAGYAWKVPLLAVLAGLAVGLAQVREAQTISALRAAEQEANRYDLAMLQQATPVEIPIGPDDPVLGPPNAPHTVVVFSDFQCPACTRFAYVIGKVQQQLAASQAARAGKTGSPAELLAYAPFKIVFKHFPLNSDCNPYYRPTLVDLKHAYACDAAAAAEAARLLGGDEAFWKMHDLLFANRAMLAKNPYRALAQQVGLDPDRFDEVRKAPETLARVQADAAQAKAVGVASTPSIFLDGRRVERSVRVFDTQDPLGRSVELWRQLLVYSSSLSRRERMTRAAGSQPDGAATQPAGSTTRPAATRPVAGRPVRVSPEQVRRLLQQMPARTAPASQAAQP